MHEPYFAGFFIHNDPKRSDDARSWRSVARGGTLRPNISVVINSKDEIMKKNFMRIYSVIFMIMLFLADVRHDFRPGPAGQDESEDDQPRTA